MNFEEYLDEYVSVCDDLLYKNPEEIKSQTDILRKKITDWAMQNSQVYRDCYVPNKIFTKNDLLDKEKWYVSFLKEHSSHVGTSGSTTGEPFSYAIYKRYASFLMNEQHWSLILKEFNLYDVKINICILYYFKHTGTVFSNNNDFVVSNHDVSNQSQYNHGSQKYSIDYINFTKFQNVNNGWYDELFKYFDKTKIDVIISTGPIINQICREIKNRNYNKKICNLLSHSNEFPRISDFNFLKNNGNIDYYCDHMRCWDGGASFFTCKHSTYHLLDCVTYHDCIDNKLITTDYFSLTAPFVNYWNGDLCEIGDKYQLCECGRYYRPFKMLENRPFALKGPTKLTEIKQQIKELNFRNKIDQVQFENLSVNLYTNSELSDDEKKILDGVLKDYKTNYY